MLSASDCLIAAIFCSSADASWARVPGLAGAAVSTVVLWTWFAGLPVGGKLGALFDLPLLVWLILWD